MNTKEQLNLIMNATTFYAQGNKVLFAHANRSVLEKCSPENIRDYKSEITTMGTM